ncbi:hypothetical protein AB1207_22820 [Kineococcus endophyticus]|uniref:Uncharacterized protein n=1 Tax=Kineococcus endophyticus TaxID=1181883 RepID=A0ABV3PD61_9ACTN
MDHVVQVAGPRRGPAARRDAAAVAFGDDEALVVAGMPVQGVQGAGPAEAVHDRDGDVAVAGGGAQGGVGDGAVGVGGGGAGLHGAGVVEGCAQDDGGLVRDDGVGAAGGVVGAGGDEVDEPVVAALTDRAGVVT